MNADWFLKLYRHMEWADALVWTSVLADDSLSNDEYVRESLLHLHVVQRAYLTGWQGSVPESRDLATFASFEHLRDWGRAYHPEASAFLGALSASDLLAKPDVLWPDFVERHIGRPPVPIPLADMVFQVAAHSVHHRAQINRRIRELGATPPFIDYVAWAWLGEPAAAWT